MTYFHFESIERPQQVSLCNGGEYIETYTQSIYDIWK